MTVFKQFRIWLRGGPAAERVASGAIAVVVAALLAWAIFPVDTSDGSRIAMPMGEASVGGPAAAAPTAVASGASPTTSVVAPAAGVAPAPVTGSAAGASSPTATGSATPASSSASAPAATSACLPSGDPSVDQGTIHLAAVLPNIQGAAGNQLVGLPSYADQIKFVKAAVADQNKRGGVACRQLAVDFYDANPLDPAGAQQRCLDIAARKYLAVIDSVMGYIAGAANCLPQHKLPTFQTSYLLPSQIKDLYPYDFSVGGRWDNLLHDWAQGLKQLGWFDPAKGFKKLGVLIDDCFPEVNTILFAELAKVGIDRGSTTVFDYGGSSCTAIAPPTQQQQAVLAFKRAGVSHVADVVAPTAQGNYFSKAAGAQQAKFAYATPDHGVITTYESAQYAPDPSYDGGIAITQSQYGALKSGVALSAGTKRCNDAMAAAGMPSVQQSGVNFAGVACNFVWTISAAISHAPALERTQLVTGLDRSGALDLSYPSGPVNYNRPGLTTAGHFWRPARWDKGCGCFKLLTGQFRPSFS